MTIETAWLSKRVSCHMEVKSPAPEIRLPITTDHRTINSAQMDVEVNELMYGA